MNKRLRVVLNILLAALVAAGLFALLRQRQNWREGEEDGTGRFRRCASRRRSPPRRPRPRRKILRRNRFRPQGLRTLWQRS